MKDLPLKVKLLLLKSLMGIIKKTIWMHSNYMS